PCRAAGRLRGGAYPGGGHRRRERPEHPAAAGQRRGRGGCRLRHFRRAGHHRRLPGAAGAGGHYGAGRPAPPTGALMTTARTIAGSAGSGGAGMQADRKTMTRSGVFGLSAITALTAQNTTGVQGILEVPPAFLAQQLDAVFTDIRPDAVKIGMVSSPALIETIGERLRFYGARNIVLDPVMVATSGARLIQPEAVETLRRVLLPMALVATPNIPEAALLAGMEIDGRPAMEQAARRIGERYGCAVLL